MNNQIKNQPNQPPRVRVEAKSETTERAINISLLLIAFVAVIGVLTIIATLLGLWYRFFWLGVVVGCAA